MGVFDQFRRFGSTNIAEWLLNEQLRFFPECVAQCRSDIADVPPLDVSVDNVLRTALELYTAELGATAITYELHFDERSRFKQFFRRVHLAFQELSKPHAKLASNLNALAVSPHMLDFEKDILPRMNAYASLWYPDGPEILRRKLPECLEMFLLFEKPIPSTGPQSFMYASFWYAFRGMLPKIENRMAAIAALYIRVGPLWFNYFVDFQQRLTKAFRNRTLDTTR